MDQGAISNFKSQYFRNAFHKATADTDRDSSNGSGERKPKTFWKRFTILDTICGSQEEVQMINTNRSLEEVDFNTHRWLWGGSRFQWRKERQMWQEQHEDWKQMRSLRTGLNCRSPTQDPNGEATSCRGTIRGFLKCNLLLVELPLWRLLKRQQRIENIT